MRRWIRFVSALLPAVCCLGVTCWYAEGASAEHGNLLVCEYSVLGGMENEHFIMTLTLGGGADILTVEEGRQWKYDWRIGDPETDDRQVSDERQSVETYRTSWHAMSDLEEYISRYDPEGWAELPYAEVYALDAPTEYLRVAYADGSEFSINSDKEQPEGSGSLMRDVYRYLKSYMAKGEPPFELLTEDGPIARDGSLVVGTDIAADEIQEFYYTYASSTNPPEYQRYYFSTEDGTWLFSHETREGYHFPLTEADITISGQVELSEDEREAFWDCVRKGKVKQREEHDDTGDAGPWLYLYWNGDQDEYQEFSFASWKAKTSFEELCVFLANCR